MALILTLQAFNVLTEKIIPFIMKVLCLFLQWLEGKKINYTTYVENGRQNDLYTAISAERTEKQDSRD